MTPFDLAVPANTARMIEPGSAINAVPALTLTENEPVSAEITIST